MFMISSVVTVLSRHRLLFVILRCEPLRASKDGAGPSPFEGR
jgi:hypothetical protein